MFTPGYDLYVSVFTPGYDLYVPVFTPGYVCMFQCLPQGMPCMFQCLPQGMTCMFQCLPQGMACSPWSKDCCVGSTCQNYLHRFCLSDIESCTCSPDKGINKVTDKYSCKIMKKIIGINYLLLL